MVVCADCGFVFNASFDAALLEYGDRYDNTQEHSPAFSAHLDSLVSRLVNERGLRGRRIVEVGCGKGGFLRRLVEADGKNSGVGFDPSYTGPGTDLGGRLRYEQRFYGPDCTDVPADAVVCRHVIEHVSDPVGLLKEVRAALDHSPQAAVFFETPCVDWILKNGVVWDFFYEHCSLFTIGSLTTAFEAAGFSVDSARHVFDGQYLWLEAHSSVAKASPGRAAGRTLTLARTFVREERLLVARWKEQLDALRGFGKVAVWGAGAKGSTFADLLDPERNIVDCVVDVNPRKQGCYLAGTGHPIVAPGDLAARGVAGAILMNPNYRTEIEGLLSRTDVKIQLIG